MEHQQPDYGTGQKKLSIYLIGLFSCTVLTLIAFGVVMAGSFTKAEMFITIFTAAIIQFLVQVICFLRLNTQTEQARMNMLSIIFTLVILVSVIGGSLWIMWSLNAYMMS